jgi:hypothetical protein
VSCRETPSDRPTTALTEAPTTATGEAVHIHAVLPVAVESGGVGMVQAAWPSAIPLVVAAAAAEARAGTADAGVAGGARAAAVAALEVVRREQASKGEPLR